MPDTPALEDIDPVDRTLPTAPAPTLPAAAQPSPAARGVALALAAAAAVTGLAIAAHHPLSPTLAVLGFAVAAAGWWRWPAASFTALLALLPIVGLAPWTGWIAFEEWELLVLAALAGSYARAVQPAVIAALPPMGPVTWLVLAAFAASQGLAMVLGFQDAGGFSFGWFQGYREPLNSLRQAKPLAAALLLLPLWTALQAQDPRRAARSIADGWCAALAAVALAALAERHAYTDILNFSTDYRTTALFWEMHVGGAALDGFLALAMPFAVRELLLARDRLRAVVLAGVVLLATYACLTTFSRIVYLAVPVGLAVTLWAHWRQGHGDRTVSRWAWLRPALTGGVFVAAFALAASQMFPTSGYRGMLALFGAMVALLALPAAAAGCAPVQRAAGLLGGLVLAGLAWLLAGLIGKGAYHAYAAVAVLALAASLSLRTRQRTAAGANLMALVAVAASVALTGCAALVAQHWGGAKALQAAAPVLVLLALAMAAATFAPRAPWPQRVRWQALTAGAMVLAASVVATFGAGVYMSGRFTTAGTDLAGRLMHWRQGLSLLETPAQQWFGRGLGRFVDDYAYIAGNQQPGDYRLRRDAGGPFVTVSAGLHELGWGELLRLSQRIALPQGPTTVALEVRADKPIVLHFEVCLKHLLYDGGCLVRQLRAPARPGEWQTMRGVLDGNQLRGGTWYAPKWVVFSVASETPTHLTDLRAITLTDGTGRQLLVNGHFERDLARWFMSSDRNHLQWHIKNIEAHVAFEQGIVGLTLFTVLVAGALLRVVFGPARTHLLAPAIGGALAGFLVVGQFDSLLDVPRVSFLFYWSVLLALASRSGLPGAVSAPSTRS